MHVTRLDIRHLRRFTDVQLRPGPGLNLITGDNGAGKTSVLEALHLMAYGRSFRGRVRDGLIQSGATAAEVFVEWQERWSGVSVGPAEARPAPLAAAASGASPRGAATATAERAVALAAVDAPTGATAESTPLAGPAVPGGGTTSGSAGADRTPAAPPAPRTRRAGLRHTGKDWEGRLDGQPVAHLGDLCAALAVVSFEPGSHALITGAADNRRRYLDWGLFHVEHEFLPAWRRYARALRQRNALLKARAGNDQLDAWDQELAEAGEPLGRQRQAYLEALEPRFIRLAAELAPMLGARALEYLPGWRRDEFPLADALLLARERDRQAGFTSVGPHRADWRIGFTGVPGRDALSRGQAKLTALAALLAQAEHHADLRGDWPIVALDDLASELDRHHQRRVLEWLLASRAQVFITGTELPPALLTAIPPGTIRFHVEQGAVSPLP